MSEQKQKPELSLDKTLSNYHHDITTLILDAAKKTIQDDIHKIIEAKRTQVEEALHKAFGVESDPVMSSSKNLIELGRKIALIKADTGKRTPAKEGGPTPEGTLEPDMITKMFEAVKRGEKIQ